MNELLLQTSELSQADTSENGKYLAIPVSFLAPFPSRDFCFQAFSVQLPDGETRQIPSAQIPQLTAPFAHSNAFLIGWKDSYLLEFLYLLQAANQIRGQEQSTSLLKVPEKAVDRCEQFSNPSAQCVCL